MGYTKYDWNTGDVITEARMDNLETQYDEGKTDLNAHKINQAAGDGRHRWTANKLLKGAGAAAPTEIAVPATATKEFFAPSLYSTVGFVPNYGLFPGAIITNGQQGYVHFHIPHDFSSIIEAVAVIISADTNANADIDIDSIYGAVGEKYNEHSEADAASVYNIAVTKFFDLDISGILTALAAGDYVAIRLWSKDVNSEFTLLGVRFKYS